VPDRGEHRAWQPELDATPAVLHSAMGVVEPDCGQPAEHPLDGQLRRSVVTPDPL
jgi:hypothetical protein